MLLLSCVLSRQVMVFFDTDHDQCLNIGEFRSCVTGLGLVMTEEQITAKMAELDTTGDGKLNFDEFAHFMAVQVRGGIMTRRAPSSLVAELTLPR